VSVERFRDILVSFIHLILEEESVEYLKAVRTQQSKQIAEILEENRNLCDERERLKREIEILEGMLEDAKIIANSILVSFMLSSFCFIFYEDFI